MAKGIKETKETKVTSAKVCAILHSITTVLWLFNAGMVLTSSISSGNKLGWNFWSDIAIAVVFGSIAVDYFIKWNKEKKLESVNTYIA
jgi:succinate dehydrogenase/fumarate reductase flavoprotein subunit